MLEEPAKEADALADDIEGRKHAPPTSEHKEPDDDDKPSCQSFDPNRLASLLVRSPIPFNPFSQRIILLRERQQGVDQPRVANQLYHSPKTRGLLTQVGGRSHRVNLGLHRLASR
jgi:hypothetical protein